MLPLLFSLSLTVTAQTPSLIGRTEAEIVATYGVPSMSMDFGNIKILGFGNVQMEFENGMVVRVKNLPRQALMPPASAEKSPSPAPQKAAQPDEKNFVGESMDLNFTSVDGRTVDLGQLEGKVVLVDFWATWCGPCVAGIPHVLEAYKKYNSKGLEVIAISLDKDKGKLLEFVKEKELPWPQYFDGKGWNNDIAKKYGIHAIPALWLINKKGEIVSQNVRDTLEGSIEKELAQ